jgi:hypothetical protein
MSSFTHHSVILGPSLCHHRLVLLYFWIRKQSLSLSHSLCSFTTSFHIHTRPSTHTQHRQQAHTTCIFSCSYILRYAIIPDPHSHFAHIPIRTYARTHTMEPYKKLKKFFFLDDKRNKSFTHTYFTGGLLVILLIYSIEVHLCALHTIILYIYIRY